jgi:uncharacterized LabA/DUF88 family protein
MADIWKSQARSNPDIPLRAQRSKNAADIQVVDTLETAFIHPDIDVFVLVTGDSDFSAVARKLRERGKLVERTHPGFSTVPGLPGGAA